MPTLPEGSLDRLTAEQAAVLAQGELHDLRGTMASVDEAIRLIESGVWSGSDFAQWWRERKAEHEATMLERFKNALRRSYQT
jgi:hypothetical protein